MLNIPEPVPLMEPVPNNSGIPGITSDTIPEFSADSQTPTTTPTTCNSGTEFRELGRTGIERNYTEFLESSALIPESDEVITESTELIPWAELVPECSTLQNRMTALLQSNYE
ncbi:unnamed protein product [Rotaria socialis]|nr:unnamed protein product [Rotaria socialis]CAF3640151.1 unnamed protein product [Rotaria socialis]CAF3717824.1 unnamed protein product [Rotaria socialis]